MDTGHEDKTSEQLHNNDSVSDTNQVDGEKGTVKISQLVVVIKYGRKKCTKISYTETGYHTHLFRVHQIHNVIKYPAQIIEGTTVNPAEVHRSRLWNKEELTFPCDECGQLFFQKSSIQTNKVQAHAKLDEDDENGNGAVKNTSPVSGENMTDENDAKLEKGREILNKMIRKPGAKKKPTKPAKKRSLPQKRSKGMKNAKLRWSARIANSSTETIDTDQTEITDETKSASEIDKSLPDIIPPRWITRSSINFESKSETRHGNEISPSTDQSAVTNVSRRSTHSGTSKLPINSATKKDQPDHPSPSAVLQKISGIITRSHTKEENVDKKEPNKVEKTTDLDNKTTHRITRSQNVVSTSDLSQPSVTENEPARMRTRSQSSDKSEMSSKSMKTSDSTHDATMDVTVSLLNLNIDANQKYMFSPLRKKDDDITYGDFTPTIS